MAKRKPAHILTLVIGVFLFMVAVGVQTGGRAAPVYDGVDNSGTVQIDIVDYAGRAEVGDNYWIELRVRNNGDTNAGIHAQCSILSLQENDWLAAQSFTVLPEEENCVLGEHFTQTARLELEPTDQETVRFTVRVPNNVGDTNYVYCSAYERCWSPGVDPLYAGQEKVPVTIVPRDSIRDNDNDANSGISSKCSIDKDCREYFWEDVVCEEGFCMDASDVDVDVETADTDATIKEWVKNNRILVVGIAIVLVVVGWFGINLRKI